MFGFAAFDAAAKYHFPHGVFQPAQGGGGLAQFGGFQCMLQRRTTVFHQNAGQQLRFKHLLQVGAFPQHPADDQVGFVFGAAAFVESIAIADAQWRIKTLLSLNLYARLQALETAQGPVLKYGLVFSGRDITKCHENSVTGVVVAAIELQ